MSVLPRPRDRQEIPGAKLINVEWHKLLAWREHHPHTVGPVVAAMLFLIVFGVVQLFTQDFYKLNPASQTVVGPVNTQLNKKLTYDAKTKLYQYNKEAASSGQPDSPQAALAAAQKSQKTGGGAKNYAVDLAADSSKGVTVHDTTDTTGSLGISLIPEFETREGKLSDGRIVYPLKGTDGQLVYSVKANGLKEDIVLSKAGEDSLSFSYRLKLPSTLEAKLLDNGNIGIYSADTALFGNISFGSDADRAKVEAARQSSAKTNLVFVIPAPVINQTGQGSDHVKAKFELKGAQLTVKATGLGQASYPLSIDPSVVVTSATDFQKGNIEGDGIDYDATGSIKRAILTGGTLEGLSDDTIPTGRHSHSTVAYNGYLYVIGGGTNNTNAPECNNNPANTITNVDYSPIDSNGNVTSWSSATALPNSRCGHSSFAYNGYVYVVSGMDGNANCQNDVYYNKINSDGSLGSSWTQETDNILTFGRTGASSFAYNGYAYLIGGNCGNGSGGANKQDVQFAPLNADGSTGAWHYTHNSTDDNTSFVSGIPTANSSGPGVTVYNGYVYVIGGWQVFPSGVRTNTVIYAPLNADGTIGTWVTSSNSLPIATYGQSAVALGGYLYSFGGCSAGAYLTCTSRLNDVYYARVNADGSIGPWIETTNFASSRLRTATTTWNGYIFSTGGYAGAGGSNQVKRFKPDPVGSTGTYLGGGNFANASNGVSTVAYNGYLYVMGGCSAANCTTVENKVRYAQINSAGTIGAFTTSGNNLVGARYGHAGFAYNGRLYVAGGCSSTTATCSAFSNSIQYSGTITAGNPGGWTDDTSNPFTTGRFWHGAAVFNDKVYVAGGCSAGDCTTALNDVQYATINSGGDVGTFSNFGNFDTNGRYKAVTVINGNHIYVVGGYDVAGAAFKSDIRFATIANDGSLSGSWADAGNSFGTARAGHAAFAYKGYLYIVGGCSVNIATCTFRSDTQLARINTDGSLDIFGSTTSLTTARSGLGATAYNGYLYAAGGCSAGNCTTFRADVEIASINNGGLGTTGTWASVGTTFTNGRYAHTAVAYKGFLYVLGGCSAGFCSTYLSDIYYAPIDASGTVGTWNPATSFPTARLGHTSVAYNGYMYVIGGEHATSDTACNGTANIKCSDVQYALINTDGTLGAWNSTTSFNTARSSHTTVAYNGYLYVIGGCSAGGCTTRELDVQYAPINANGTIGTWNSTTSFATARWVHTTVAYNGYLYVIGGEGAGGNLNDVQYAPINADGTIGTWKNTNSFDTIRQGLNAVAQNGYLYVLGGYNTGFLTTVQYAPINVNGTIGSWTPTTTNTTNRTNASSVTYNGRLYMTGGCTTVIIGCSAVTNASEYAGQLAIPRKGIYSYMTDFGGDAMPTKLLPSGTAVAGSQLTFGIRRALSSNAIFGSNTNFLDTRFGSLLSVPAAEGRYRQLTFTLDDSGSATFPDSLSSPTTISDFELWYHSAPTKRLRGGKTFTGQTLQTLDATPY